MFGYRYSYSPPPADRRQVMIAQTSAFLTWALANDVKLPVIPRRPASQGGFDRVLEHPGARAAAGHWWLKAIQAVGKIADL